MGKDGELLQAVKKGDVSAIRKLLMKFKSSEKAKKAVSKKLHVNSADDNGFTVLHHAALVNNVEVVLALIEMEADPNARDKKGMCPLHMASWAGKDQIVKALIENRALVNLPSFSGETPLLLASQHGYANVVEILLKYNADPTIRNNNLESPLDLSCQFGHAATVKLLLMKGEVAHMLRDRHNDARYKNPLHIAAKGGHADVVRLLIESGADVNEETAQGTALHLAALYGKVEVTKLLLEAGADVSAVNKKSMTPLDMLNQFTTSRAGIEIKMLLREASGEKIVYAKAVSDHINVYDPTCLSFRAGDIITVLKQNEDGRWKGSLSEGQQEKVGFFPAKAVMIISNKKDTHSLGSMSSSSDSSISSLTTGKDSNSVPKSPSKRISESQQPVGVVPVGSFEVLTLTTATQNQERKKRGGNIPRLNSFKKESASMKHRKATSNEQIASDEPKSPSLNISMDSNVCSHGPFAEPTADSLYDKVPTTSSNMVESNIYDPVPSPTSTATRIHEVDMTKQENNQQNNYADIIVQSNGNKPISPGAKMTTRYAEVYVSEKPQQFHDANNFQTELNARLIPRGSQQKFGSNENYENMNFSGENTERLSRTPEEISKLRSASQIGGYEDMSGSSSLSSSDSFPPPPSLPLKSAICNEQQQIQATLPPKKIGSRAIHRRQDSYENVAPRQLVPVQIQSPFDNNAASVGNTHSTLPSPGLSCDQAASFDNANYQNYIAPGIRSHSLQNNTYENYRPEDTEERKVRAATVVEKPRRIPASRPVPLPPKMNRRNSSGPMSPSPNSPTDTTSSSPFLAQINLHELKEDEKELLNWLIDMKLPQYFQNFQTEGYDMISIRGLSPEDLNALNITKAGHKKKLLSEVAKLRQSDKLPSHKPDDVGAWLDLLGLRMYEENFIDGGFDDMDFIKDLDLSDLEMIDIKKRGHQKKLLLAVQKLADVELTADLDEVIQGSVGNTSFTQQQQQQQQQEFTSTDSAAYSNHSSSMTAVDDTFGQKSPSPPSTVFPPVPVAAVDQSFLAHRDHLPPPSGTESVTTSNEIFQPKAHAHINEPTTKLDSSSAQELPLRRERTNTAPNAPRPKPKPKPGQNRGQVRTASEYHATESPNKTFILPTPVLPQKGAPSQQQPEISTTSATSTSRDFWLEQQGNSAGTPSRSKSIKPVISPRPSVKPKAVAMTEPKTELIQSPQQEKQSDISSRKKVPPPTPPRRDSTNRKSNQMIQENQMRDSGNERTRTTSGPLDEKIRDVFRGKKVNTSCQFAEAPVVQTELKEEDENAISEERIDEELEVTDSIMADIDNMIADFNIQLDSMF